MTRQWELFCLGVLSLVHGSHQILKHMSDDEIRQVFHTNRKTVPEYEVVRLLHSKDGDRLNVHLKAFGDDVNLYLNPVEGTLFAENTPVYTVKSNASDSKGLHYELISGKAIDAQYQVFEDLNKMATVVAYQGKDERIHFSGPYGIKYVIRTLPSRIMKLVAKHKKYNDPEHLPRVPGNEGNLRMSDHHVVVKYVVNKETGHLEDERNAIVKTKKIRGHERFSNRFAKPVPNVVHPEILVIVDYDCFKSHDFNVEQTMMYYAAFLNAVDLKYRALENPKVRLHIASIIIAMDREATPYLNEKRVNDHLIDSSALDATCVYLYGEKRFPQSSYDLAIVITNSELRQCKKKADLVSTCVELRGISKYGTACNWDHSTKRVESTALVHDAGFDGIATAAHEIAHVFGVPHDGSPSLSYVGGPGAQDCKWEDGYLMSSSRHNENALNWSPCSQTCFRYFFSKPEASCIYNVPKREAPLPRLLPGKLLSVDEQCLKATGGKSCWQDERVCTLLWCQNPDGDDDCIASTPAAEGSKCGEGKMCIFGQCRKTQ